MPEPGKDPSFTLKENPAVPDEAPTRPEFNVGVDPERPQELVDRLEQIEAQDITAPGPQETHPRPYGWPGEGEDEGPLGDTGQLGSPDETAGDS